MELQFPLFMSLTSTFSFLLLLLFSSVLVILRRRSDYNKKLPPGPWKLPFIGSIHHLLSTADSVLPQRALRDLSRRYGPLMHLQLGEISAIVVSSPIMAERVMKTHDLVFANRPQELVAPTILTYGNQNIAFAPYGPYWRQMRKICVMELLSVKNVRSFASIREDEVTKLVRSISSSPRTPVNVTEKFYSLFNTVTSRAAFGTHCKDRDVFVKLLQEAMVIAGGAHLCDVFPSMKMLGLDRRLKEKVENMQRRFDMVFDKIIKEHEENMASTGKGNGESGEEDLVDALLRHQKSGGLDCPITTNSIKAVIQDMFGAGTETSSTTIEWAMSELMRNPKTMEKAQTEVREALKGKKTVHQSDVQGLKYLEWVIKETLRLHPPLPLLLPRESTEECCIDGYNIPVKTKVIINAWAIGRDPEYWEDAESFRPERFDEDGKGNISLDYTGSQFHYIPFGAGRRICPGLSFGITNSEFALAQLLYHFNWELPNGIGPDDLDMAEKFGITAGRKNDLCLVATPYDHLSVY